LFASDEHIFYDELTPQHVVESRRSPFSFREKARSALFSAILILAFSPSENAERPVGPIYIAAMWYKS
jgi:hypothetical protein